MENKVYNTTKEKVIDFFIGFLGIPAVVGVMAWIFFYLMGTVKGADSSAYGILSIAALASPFLLMSYFYSRRRYIYLGLLFAIFVIPLVALGTCYFSFWVPMGRMHSGTLR
jgi:hypothetical protein